MAARDQFIFMLLGERTTVKKPKAYVPQPGDRYETWTYDGRRRIVEVVRTTRVHAFVKTIAVGPLPTRVGELTQVKRAETRIKLKRLRKPAFRGMFKRCHECQVARGGVVPSFGHRGITVTSGTCRDCLQNNVTLVPSCDYNWPKEGKNAVWD